MTELAAASRAELRRLVGNRLDLALLTLMPLVLLGLMAAMISGGSPRDLGVVVVDHDRGALARAIVRRVDETDRLAVVGHAPDLGTALSQIRRERAIAVLVIPRGVGAPRLGAPVPEIYYQAVFLSTGALGSSVLRAVVLATLAERVPRAIGVQDPATPRSLPGVSVTILGNPSGSLEWYLGLLLGPGILHLLVAVTCIGALAPVLEGEVRTTLSSLVGRMLPHIGAGTLWSIGWMIWLTLARGYRAEGGLWLIALGLLLLFAATAGVALLLVGATREIATSLSGAVIVTGSALAYSGASLPLEGGWAIARAWSAILPLTHYIRLQMDQVLGASAAPTAREMAVLLLYPLLAGGGGALLLIRRARRAA